MWSYVGRILCLWSWYEQQELSGFGCRVPKWPRLASFQVNLSPVGAGKNTRGVLAEWYKVATTELLCPYSADGVAAGFPSPADDHIELELDLNRYLVKNSAATFFARAKGSSMVGVGIHDGDLLVIDRSLEWRDGQVAVCFVSGEFTVKRLVKKQGGLYLISANPEFAPVKVSEQEDFRIWGVVSYVIHKLGGNR